MHGTHLSRFPQYSKRSGFTLVELAIVLVIVGLLIGGILVAQSMISTAKINSQVRQFQQFDTAVANFITRYNAAPGDYAGLYSASELSTYVDYAQKATDNGYIDFRCYDGVWSGYAPNGYDEYSEAAWFWVSLQRGVGFKQDGATFTAIPNATSFNISSSVRNGPKSAISDKASLVAISTYYTWPSETIAAYVLANYSGLKTSDNSFTTAANPVITPSQAMGIDKKMDDGRPATGMIRPWNYSSVIDYLGWYVDGVFCSNGTIYNASDSTDVCALTVQIMSQSGGIPGRGTTY